MPLQEDAKQSAVSDFLGELAEEDIIQRSRYNSRLIEHYSLAFRIPMSGGRSAVIQLAPYYGSMRFLRMEFNPCRPTCSGAHPMERMQTILESAWRDLPAAIESEAKFTRIDFAVEFENVHIGDVDFFHRTRPAEGRILNEERDEDRDEVPTGRYVGRRTSNRYAAMYNKKLQARKHLAYIMRNERTRLEIRLANAGSISTIENMPNPFANYVLFLYPSDEGNLSLEKRRFLASCRELGAQTALTRIHGGRERSRYRRFLTEYSPSWWDPEAIWRERRNALRDALYP